MRGLWLEDRRLSLRTDLPEPTPQVGQALVRVLMAGICGTDLEMVKGYAPLRGVLGHEFVGRVVEAPGAEFWLGQRVVGEINLACGLCDMCQAGLRTHCRQRRVLGIRGHNGAFAEALLLPVENLHLVPAAVPDQTAVFTEPLAAALQIQQQVNVQPGQQVLLVGAGRLGQLIALSLAAAGCELTVLARHANQQRLLEQAGISWSESFEAVEGRLEARCDLVVEASGSPQGLSVARRAVRPRGVIVLKSTYHGEVQTDLSSLVVQEVTLVGSRCGPFNLALEWLAGGRLDPRPLVDSVWSLDEGLPAMQAAGQPGRLKVLLSP